MERGFDGFLGMIRFGNPWVVVAMVVLLFWNIPLAIILRKNYMMEEKTKRIIIGISIAVSVILIFVLFMICAENGFPEGKEAMLIFWW